MLRIGCWSLRLAAGALALGATTALAQAPAEAYAKGCASCHRSERSVLRAIPAGDEAQRKAWIEKFLARHPNDRHDLTPLIVDYLLQRTRR